MSENANACLRNFQKENDKREILVPEITQNYITFKLIVYQAEYQIFCGSSVSFLWDVKMFDGDFWDWYSLSDETNYLKTASWALSNCNGQSYLSVLHR